MIRAVAVAYDVTVPQLQGRTRTLRLAHVRHVAMLELRLRTGLSLGEIGDLFHRDHTTVLAGLRRVKSRLASGWEYRTLKRPESS